jgi:hypothetical protein
MSNYYFKRNKTNGSVYMQIWKKVVNGKDEFVRSIGKPEKVLNDLVRLDDLEKQTKKYEEMLTKDLRGGKN